MSTSSCHIVLANRIADCVFWTYETLTIASKHPTSSMHVENGLTSCRMYWFIQSNRNAIKIVISNLKWVKHNLFMHLEWVMQSIMTARPSGMYRKKHSVWHLCEYWNRLQKKKNRLQNRITHTQTLLPYDWVKNLVSYEEEVLKHILDIFYWESL